MKKHLRDSTAAATEAERRALARAITIKAVAKRAGCSVGYVSTNCNTWRKFEAERKRWTTTKQRDAFDRARDSKRFAKSRSRPKVGRAIVLGDDRERTGIEGLVDTNDLDPVEVVAYEELRTKYLADGTSSDDERRDFEKASEEVQRLALDGYQERLEERRHKARSRMSRS